MSRSACSPHAGKRVKMDVEDPDAPKLSSALRKPDPFEPGASGRVSARALNKHITFGGGDMEVCMAGMCGGTRVCACGACMWGCKWGWGGVGWEERAGKVGGSVRSG
jgi:hypothetical protein